MKILISLGHCDNLKRHGSNCHCEFPALLQAGEYFRDDADFSKFCDKDVILSSKARCQAAADPLTDDYIEV